jgi:hypothetical protein
MTHFRSVLFAAALTALVGCSAQAANSSDSAAADSTETPALATQTIVQGDLPVGATTTVSYDPTEYTPTTINGVPYLAWSLDTKAAALSVDVSGQFPGAPDVLVTDSNFNVLAKADGQKLADGTGLAAASLSVNVPAGPKMLLVRDKIWVRQMTFDISVAQ